MDAIVERLRALVDEHGWHARFERAVTQVQARRIPALAGLGSLDRWLEYLDALAHWAPREQGDSRQVHDKLVQFHFLFDQDALRDLQSPIAPGAAASLTPLSQWMCSTASTPTSSRRQGHSATRRRSSRPTPGRWPWP